MAAWRGVGVGGPTLLAGLLVLAVVQPGRAQTHPLTETVKPGDCFHIGLDMSLTGELRIPKDGKVEPIPLKASAQHEYHERVLNVSDKQAVERTARVYRTARAAITVASGGSTRELRGDRRLVVAQRQRDELLVYCPAGPLTREELDVTNDHFDTLAITGVLPGKAVAVGETWKVADVVVQALCHFEGMTEHTLTGKLDEVRDGTARISVTGTATGIDLGALVKLTIKATGEFDLKAGRLRSLEWQQTDERDQGPASPATKVQLTTTVKRTPIAQPEHLSDVALVSVPEHGKDLPPLMSQLYYCDPKARYDMCYTREWQIVSQTDEHLVMRLLDRGNFVAQVTITPWTPAEPGKHLSPEEFKEAMARTPGWEAEVEIQAGEVPHPGKDGPYLYRISQQGKLDGVAVLQNFYLIAGKKGQQVVLAFTMTPKQAEVLGTRDLSIVHSLDFPTGRDEEKPNGDDE
jgi:hypothetical protein